MTMIDPAIIYGDPDVEAPAAYTEYARKLCPTWCTQPHINPTDAHDLTAVMHAGIVGSVSVRDLGTAQEGPDLIEADLQQYDNLDDDNIGPTIVMHGRIDDTIRNAEDTVAIALLMIQAAERLRQG